MSSYEEESRKLYEKIKDDCVQTVAEDVFGVSPSGVSGGICDKKAPFIAVNREATPEEIEDVGQDEVKWSMGEKVVLSTLQKQEPPLRDKDGKPYGIRCITTANGHVAHVYDMPYADKVEHLKRLWPFWPTPDEYKLMYDMHSDTTAPFCDCRIIRWNRFNMVVAPDYLNTGGMAVDLEDADKMKRKEE